jgi:hypothetical protein
MISAKAKSLLVLLITLVIGVAIGFEISEIMLKNRFEEMKSFREPKGFVNIFEDIIKPDNNQKPIVDSILVKYHKKMEAVTRSGMAQVSVMMDSMQVELKTAINEEQFHRLNNEMTRMKNRPTPFRNHGEPGPRPNHDRPMPPPDGGLPPREPMP